MSLLYYKRPDYVEKSTAPMAASDHRTFLERQRASIPPELCFEYVIANRAVPVRLITTFSLSLSALSSPSFFFFLFFFFSFFFGIEILDLKGKEKERKKALTLSAEGGEKWGKNAPPPQTGAPLPPFPALCIKNSHVHYSISPAICSMSRTMPRTSSSTCGFRIIRNDSFNAQGEIRPFRRRGIKTATPS